MSDIRTPWGSISTKVSLFPILASISIFFYMKMTTGQQMASQPQPQEGMQQSNKLYVKL